VKLLVTGAAGFIGSTYARQVCTEHEVVVLDKLTYAGRRENLEGLPVELVVGAIEDRELVRETMRGCDAVVNFAAESHVDRSIADQDAFARTHVIGTSILLDAARELGLWRYLQVSTDEVYGSVESGSFTESSPLRPSSPYSATKAAGDLLVSAHVHTHGIEAVICRGSNNYGPRQYPEKLIPLTILNALHGDPLPVYGDGRQVRNWLHVEDFCRGIHTVLLQGRPGEVYNVGGPDETQNIEVVRRIVEHTGADPGLIQHVRDRPGHDRRYSLASDKLRSELGWSPEVRFERGLRETVDWYRDNESWWQPIRSGDYRDYYQRQYGRGLRPGARTPPNLEPGPRRGGAPSAV
jgi:dTDP-glucose 4,6-dehydratase